MADIDAVGTVRTSAEGTICALAPAAHIPVLASAGKGASFRVAAGIIDQGADSIGISRALAHPLGVGPGDALLYAPA